MTRKYDLDGLLEGLDRACKSDVGKIAVDMDVAQHILQELRTLARFKTRYSSDYADYRDEAEIADARVNRVHREAAERIRKIREAADAMRRTAGMSGGFNYSAFTVDMEDLIDKAFGFDHASGPDQTRYAEYNHDNRQYTYRERRQREEASRPPRPNQARGTWYEILGVHPSSDADTIRKAFRLLVKGKHPDTAVGHEEYVKQLTEAKAEGLAGLR